MKFFGKSFQRGYIFIAFALMLPLFILFMLLVLELGRGFTYKAKLQNVVDAAALAGAGQIEHQGAVRLVSAYTAPEETTVTNAETADDTEEENLNKSKADTAADKSIQANGFDVVPKTELQKDDSSYYYHVQIQDHVPLVLARMFLPDSFMPEGLPVSAQAWAKAEKAELENSVYDQAYNIGWNQTAKLMEQIRKAGSDRAYKVDGNDGIHYNYSVDEHGNVSMSRTETVTTREVKTWKYMFVDFQPDIQMNVKQGININGEYNFPFENWDVTSVLSESDLSKLQYANILNLSTQEGRNTLSRNNLINKLMSEYRMSYENAVKLLSTRIENIVLFNDLHKVRGSTAKALEDWEKQKIKQGGLAAKEQLIADYTGNSELSQLVVRNSKGEIVVSDPLLVRIESEDIRRIHSYSNDNIFYTSSVRKLTLKINVDNMASDNRPLIIYYYGPQDSDENVGAGRESQPVTLELNANFKGMLFAPYSPDIVKSNGYKIRGLVIGKSFMKDENTVITSASSPIYSQFGFSGSDVDFDDFGLLDISEKFKKDENVFLTSEQAKKIK